MKSGTVYSVPTRAVPNGEQGRFRPPERRKLGIADAGRVGLFAALAQVTGEKFPPSLRITSPSIRASSPQATGRLRLGAEMFWAGQHAVALSLLQAEEAMRRLLEAGRYLVCLPCGRG